MYHRWFGLLVAATLLATACGDSANRTEWAAEAEAWHDALITAQIAQGGAAFGRFYAPDVVLNDSAIVAPLLDEPYVWDQYAEDTDGCFRRVGTEAIQVAAWLMGPESLRLEPEVFISVDGLVGFWFYDWAPLDNDHRPDTKDPLHGVSLMTPIGPLGVEYLVNAPAVED